MSQKGILHPILSIKDKVLLSTGIKSLGSNSTEAGELSTDNGFYAEVGVPVVNDFPRKNKRFKDFVPKPIVMAMNFVVRLFAARVVIIFCLLYFISPYAFSQTTQQPTVQTDQQDYPPGSTVYITGSGFMVNEPVTLQVLHVGEPADDQISTAHQPWTVTADSVGNITATWVVPPDQDEYGATLQLTATGQSSGLIAQVTFTDANPNTKIVVTNVTGTYGGTATFTATLTQSSGPGNGNAIQGKTINFVINGTAVGSATTNSSGVATLPNIALTLSGTRIPAGSPTITASFTADASFNGSSATGTLTVNPLAITWSFTASDKVYDGNTTAAIASISLSGVLSPDVVTTSGGTATFANKNVGAGKTVTAALVPTLGSANYTLTGAPTPSTTASLTARALTVTATVTGGGKVYDGTTAATVTLGDNRVSGDVFVGAFTSATYADKNVGNGKTVTVSGISITGTDAGNYTFNATANPIGNITAKVLTISASASNKVYNGINAATVTLSDNRVSGDVFNDAFTSATFSSKTVANGKTVTVSGISISGADAGNYTANTTATTTANITPRALAVTASASNKIYNGSTAATVTLNDDRVAGDVFSTTNSSATFADKNVGTGKTVTVSGITITGTDAANYAANTTTTTTADITVRPITVTATGVNKTYDGTASATVSLSDNKVSGDIITDAYIAAGFADKTVANGRTVSVSGISISGADVGNYSLSTTTATATANITAKALTITAAAANKVYDGTNSASATLSDNRISGDVFTDSFTSATFSSASVGTAKTVNVSGISIGGADAGNYSFNTSAATTASITSRTLTVTALASNKVYDGTTAASVTVSDNRTSGDNLTVHFATSTFSDKNVGSGKIVTVTPLSITGPASGNYTLAGTTITTTANITQLPLLIAATGINKVYDGTTTATVTLTDNRLPGDAFIDTYTSANFADKNVGTGKTVSVSGISITGTDAGNYSFNSTATTTANISVASVTITADAQTRIYGDPDPALTYKVTSGTVVTGDSFSGSLARATGEAVGSYPIGQGTVTLGTNYALSYSGANLDITARPVTITADAKTKIYGDSDPTLTYQ
ncbi:S-layer family protein, partial [Mucilaginibacter sp. BT774]|uniref:beta strand repeat-containing protein n=1 Tax=Mucilaginibacter sp. BT774 TaxID=3062276 RepID=UPI002676A5CF